ncbi:hypothetical protein NEF87_002169 [Candidatus Lokiarchaeum ossiferum]|uniref:Immune inhibitor A peptidase M6 n=1 Tax=Candidatus Lokiarchaeum ossiferum TaxID=2951803 RepID=A0ABY6HTV6_9ARCH|nr:hypothetical protein NEF87_002169 [Candidatus Lokiarchaeum sp. B-35]
MKVKNFSFFLMGLLVFNVAAMVGLNYAAASMNPAIPDYEPMSVSEKLLHNDMSQLINPSDVVGEDSDSGSETVVEEAIVGEVKYFLSYDDVNGMFVDAYQLQAAGPLTEIWVQLDMTYPEGDPREDPVVTQEQLDYLLNEFESNIYPIDTTYFGTPDEHTGEAAPLAGMLGLPEDYYLSNEGKIIIQISNIRDTAYYDYTYPSYIAGFYWGTYEYYFNRNIINIDSSDWENRVGPDVARPFLYEGTIAHELQHLIHADYNPADDTFMNEGCSMYSEPLCGYGYSWGRMGDYFATPDNSLTNWEDQGGLNVLADYGCAQLWTVYLADHYGGAAFISHFVQAGIGGIEGINAALAYFNYTITFDDIYRDWRIANMLDLDDSVYGYPSIDFDEVDNPLRIYNVSTPVADLLGTDFGTTTGYGGDSGISKLGSYGSDYIKFTPGDYNFFDIFAFDGDDTAEYGWELTEDGWYSGAAALYDVSLISTATVDTADPYLRLDSMWSIEDYWDFGFVQISTDNGETWTSLANENTTTDFDPSGHPDIQANLPGLTGTGDGIIEFDLSAYAGQEVMLSFRYMTDWGTEFAGWIIRSASVSGVEIELVNVQPEAEFLVTIVEVYNWCGEDYYYIYDLNLYDAYETGFGITAADEYYMIVSPTMENGMVDYEINVLSFGMNCHRYRHMRV